ncbi:MAG TPA: XrtA/PEP-CTERM system-associated ATPase [Planctomycetota bacterium]|nr:XrtA/PEP-CTERM system-associated ATPase [Planctomycetota bacterium]
MFTEFYGLRGQPFQLGPDPRFFFGSSGHRKAMAYLTYALEQGEGFLVITGEVGAGKTTLIEHLLSTLDRRRFIAATIVTTQVEADDLLRLVAHAFGLPASGRDKAGLLSDIHGFLVASQEAGKHPVLIVDEIQNLSMRSMEELRMLTNFQRGQRSLLQGLLVGQPQFRAILVRGELEQLRQRVIASYHLGPMSGEETVAYVEHRLGLVGWRCDPEFTADAFDLIHQHTGGIPRRINTLCTRLLLFGCIEELHRIDGPIARQIAEELRDEFSVPASAIPTAGPATGTGGGDLGRRIDGLEQRVNAQERQLYESLALVMRTLGRDRNQDPGSA